MQVDYLKKFSKDLDVINQKSVKASLLRMITLMETVNSLDKIPETKN